MQVSGFHVHYVGLRVQLGLKALKFSTCVLKLGCRVEGSRSALTPNSLPF